MIAFSSCQVGGLQESYSFLYSHNISLNNITTLPKFPEWPYFPNYAAMVGIAARSSTLPFRVAQISDAIPDEAALRTHKCADP